MTTYPQGDVFEDIFADWSKVYKRSNGWNRSINSEDPGGVFKAHPYKIGRLADNTQYIVYKVSDVVGIEIVAYVHQGHYFPGLIEFHASADDTTYTQIQKTVLRSADVGGDWNKDQMMHDQQFPENTDYVKIIVRQGSSVKWTPQIANVKLTYLGDVNDVEENIEYVPVKFSLHQNYPNPFNPETQIRYTLPLHAKVQLKIYDILGRQVRTLVNENKAAGSYLKTWDGLDQSGNRVSSGLYFYRLEAKSGSKSFTEQKKMLLVK